MKATRVGLALCALALLGNLQAMEQTKQPAGGFSHRVETDSKTGWKIVELKHQPGGTSEPLAARIAPAAGSNLYSIKLGETELLVQPPELSALPGNRYGFPILYPTPNRVRDGKFTFDGVTYSFPPNNRGNFIHGLVHSLPWQMNEPTSDRNGARLETWLDWNSSQPNFRLFPIEHRLHVNYTMTPGGVRIEFAVENRGDRRLPFGFALHPWFRILGARAQTYLHVPARKHMEAVDLLPTGKLADLEGSPLDLRKPVSLEGLKLDDVYWGLTPDRVPGYEARDHGIAVTLGASREFTHMVVYTPAGRPYFCMENQTCSTDAHNLDARGLKKESHLLVAQKGKPATGWVMVGVKKSEPRPKSEPQP